MGVRLVPAALSRDEEQRVLLADRGAQAGEDRYGLVGGPAGPWESAYFACQRHVKRETALKAVPGALLVVHCMPDTGTQYLVFDCAAIPPPGHRTGPAARAVRAAAGGGRPARSGRPAR